MTNRATLEALLARVLDGTGPDEQIAGQMHDWREIRTRIEGHALHEGQPQGR